MARADEIIYRDKLFVRRSFTRTDLARELGTNRTYVGEALSACRNCSWRDYINSFRVRYFLETAYLEENRHRTITELAELCGFGSPHTLNVCLKKTYGITASFYKKNLSIYLRAEGNANTATLS